jgi:hypothetical protein
MGEGIFLRRVGRIGCFSGVDHIAVNDVEITGITATNLLLQLALYSLGGFVPRLIEASEFFLAFFESCTRPRSHSALLPQNRPAPNRAAGQPPSLPARLSPLAWSAAAPAAASAAEITAASAARATPVYLRPGFIHIERPSAQIVPVQRRDGAIGFGRVGHFNKRKATRTAGLPVGHQIDAFYRAMRFKEGPNRLLGGAEIQVAYENILHRISLLFECGYHEAESHLGQVLRDNQMYF